MNLALADIRSNVPRFIATSVGISLLFTVVLAMAGIYGGLVDDAIMLARASASPLWVVQRDSRGPFADQSRLDPSIVLRVAGVPGVARARGMTYQVLQRLVAGRELRFALVGLEFPEDDGRSLRVVAGRALQQAQGELIVDAALGIPLGEVLQMAGEEYDVVGLTRQLVGPSGDPVMVATLRDAQLIAEHLAPDARMMERARRIERLRQTELASLTPTMEGLLQDPAWAPPAIPRLPINAVLIDIVPGVATDRVQGTLARWSDVSVLGTDQQERVLLDGAVDKPKRQLALFSAILVVTSSILIAALIYMMTLGKLHDIAMLRLLGASSMRIGGMVLQQAWWMALLGYSSALVIGHFAFPHFPRRIVLEQSSILMVGGLVFVVCTASSLFAVRFALRLDPARALES